MNKEWVLTQEDFDRLLLWLNRESREEAGRKYEEIRCRLIKIFSCRGCTESDLLSDETINRVTKKLREIEGDWTGDPALYFYGVAQRVHLEYLRKRPHTVVPQMPLAATVETEDTDEDDFECLEHCMQRLPPPKRELLERYYQEDGQAKIDNRKRLAEQLGIALNALRIRAHRIRLSVQECVQDCLAERAAG